MVQGETRKGPWTEQEDLQLVYIVRLLGERRWDTIAKVSGWRGFFWCVPDSHTLKLVIYRLNRSGKSCRLRWVNYLHPGLKHGRMTPQEEHQVLELHRQWGNRWSRIARRLPGRTDNEIKNYWRTHMRKEARERKRALSHSTSSNCHSNPTEGDSSSQGVGGQQLKMSNDKAISGDIAMQGEESPEKSINSDPMDQIWKEIEDSSETIRAAIDDCSAEQGSIFSLMPSPVWDFQNDFFADSIWKMEEEEHELWVPIGDLFESS